MLNRYFAPYAEYTQRTKLSEEELRTALKRKCGHFFRNRKNLFSRDHFDLKKQLSRVYSDRESEFMTSLGRLLCGGHSFGLHYPKNLETRNNS